MERLVDSSDLDQALAEAINAHFYEYSYGALAPGTTAASHYISQGWREGRDPNPWFSTRAYLAANPEVADEEQVPLFHFMVRGSIEGEKPVASDLADAYYSRAAWSNEDRHVRHSFGSSEPSSGEIDIDRALFAPTLYAAAEQLSGLDDQSLWEHFKSCRAATVTFPSFFFDARYYRQQIEKGIAPPMDPGEAPFEHWLREGLPRHVVPTPRFDEEFYRAAYHDMAASEDFGFLHFIQYGLSEGRRPNPWFDPSWYATQAGPLSEPAYIHFLTKGVLHSLTPCIALERFAKRTDCTLTLTLYDELLEASKPLSLHGSTQALDLLLSLYQPEFHRENSGENDISVLIRYFRSEIGAGVAPGPLFDAGVYIEKTAEVGLAGDVETALTHWLTYGIAARVVPTERFDEAYYRATYPDIGQSDLWGFAHFLQHGAYEGRRENSDRGRLTRVDMPKRSGIVIPPTAYRRWLADFGRSSELPEAIRREDETAYEVESRMRALLDSGSLERLIERARAFEPTLKAIDEKTEIRLPHLSEPLYLAHADVSQRFLYSHYDSIICMPWMRLGGADLVAGLLADGLLRINPNERVLILRTDASFCEQPSWYPGGAEIVDISDIHANLSQVHAEKLLQAVLLGLTPLRVINVNSLLCWNTMRRFGERLSESMKIFACLFCWDVQADGAKGGYASADYFAANFDTIAAILTDTEYFKNDLIQTYAIPAALREKIVPVRMPARLAARTPSVARIAASNSTEPKVVIWAGRLDRQKRFDLVLQIARLMPDVQFHCWGKAVVDDAPAFESLPANVTMHEPYTSFDELPLTQVGAWLFTSAWEGLPNILIEIATLGVPVVATAVGGVPELVRPDTGWPVDAEATADVYVRELRHVLGHPEEGVRRAELLQALVLRDHGVDSFDRALGEFDLERSATCLK